MPPELTTRPRRSPDATSTTVTDRSGRRERVRLTEYPLDRLDGQTAAVVAPRLRTLLLDALETDGRIVGAVNAYRWGCPCWLEAATALSPVRLAVPIGTHQSETTTVSLVVEAGPNHAHPLRARPVASDEVTGPSLELENLPEPIVRSLVPLVESGRTRLPATSPAFRVLAGDRPTPPAQSLTLGNLRSDGDTYRVDRPAFDPGGTPYYYLVASAYPSTRDPVATLALPPVDRRTAHLVGGALRDSPSSLPAAAARRAAFDLTAREYLLTPGGVYEVAVEGQ